MNYRETGKDIDDQAAQWVARLDRHAGDWHVDSELDLWLQGDRRRQGAFLRAQAAFLLLDRARMRDVDQYVPSRTLPWQRLSRRQIIGGGGAAAAGVLVAGLLAKHAFRETPGLRFATGLGEIRRVPLADGSIAVINTDSELLVRISAQARRISLIRGEAWFEVAHDAARPFLVEADDVVTQAIGTAFSVRRTAGTTGIIVTNGTVEVKSETAGSPIQRVSAGWQTIAYQGKGVSAPFPAPDAIERSLAWRDGEIVLGGDTLEQAAAEFNRYNSTQIGVVGVELAQRRIVGRFRTNDVDGFANAAITLLGARRERGHDGRILLIQS